MKRTCTSHVANAVVLPNLGRQSAYLYGFSINIRLVLGRLTLYTERERISDWRSGPAMLLAGDFGIAASDLS